MVLMRKVPTDMSHVQAWRYRQCPPMTVMHGHGINPSAVATLTVTELTPSSCSDPEPAGRHMLTEMVVDSYIPNDTNMTEDDSRVQVSLCK